MKQKAYNDMYFTNCCMHRRIDTTYAYVHHDRVKQNKRELNQNLQMMLISYNANIIICSRFRVSRNLVHFILRYVHPTHKERQQPSTVNSQHWPFHFHRFDATHCLCTPDTVYSCTVCACVCACVHTDTFVFMMRRVQLT